MALSWHSFDLRTGKRGQRVEVESTPALRRIIGEATDASLNVQCWRDGAPVAGWEDATEPGRRMLVALDDEDERIIWGGMVLRQVSGKGAWVSTSVATLEHYLGRRFVGDLTFTGADQASIVAGIIGNVAVDGLDFTVDAPAEGQVRNRTYLDDEDKTALSVLSDLSGVVGGPEFTVDLEWANDARTEIRRVFRARQRIGTPRQFTTVWSLPGCVIDFAHTKDATEEFFANDVMASSSGEGASRPESNHVVATDLLAAGYARFEERFTPSTSITDVATLNSHAARRAVDMRLGLTSLTVVAALDQAPRINADWWLGDDITIELTCERFPERNLAGSPAPGLTRRLRVVGWTIDPGAGTLTPDVREVAA